MKKLDSMKIMKAVSISMTTNSQIAGLGNPGWLLSSAGQEDGVKTRFPSHTITTV